MRSLLLAMLLIWPHAALADATLTIVLTGAGAANTSRALVLSDADGARLLAWARESGPLVEVAPASTDPAICQQVVPPLSTDPVLCVEPMPPQCLSTTAPANPMPPQCLPTQRTMTALEAAQYTFTKMLSDLRDKVLAHERAKAAKDAFDAIPGVIPK